MVFLMVIVAALSSLALITLHRGSSMAERKRAHEKEEVALSERLSNRVGLVGIALNVVVVIVGPCLWGYLWTLVVLATIFTTITHVTHFYGSLWKYVAGQALKTDKID